RLRPDRRGHRRCLGAQALFRRAGQLLHQAGGDCRRGLARHPPGQERLVVQCRDPPIRREMVTAMADLRIFSYLPNPRIWKATIAARLCRVEVEVRGAKPAELKDWLWDFDAHPLTEADRSTARPRAGR